MRVIDGKGFGRTYAKTVERVLATISKPDALRKVVEALNAVHRRAGLPEYQRCEEIVAAMQRDLLSASRSFTANEVAAAGMAFGVVSKLKSLPTISAVKLEEFIHYLKRRYLTDFRKHVFDLAKQLPHASGGRPRRLADSDDKNIYEIFLGHLGTNMKRTDAQRKIAEAKGVSIRTIQRAIQREEKRRSVTTKQ